MRDYNYYERNGVNTPVSKMATQDIYDCLANGIEPREDGVTAENVMERLRIELTARALGLRT